MVGIVICALELFRVSTKPSRLLAAHISSLLSTLGTLTVLPLLNLMVLGDSAIFLRRLYVLVNLLLRVPRRGVELQRG